MKTPWLPKKPKTKSKRIWTCCWCRGAGVRSVFMPGKGVIDIKCTSCGGKGFIS